MRVTNNMLVNNLVSNVNRNLLNMSKMQDQLATGKKVHTASDDPVAASKIIKFRTDIAEYEQYERNTSDALSWLESTEGMMMNVNTVLQRARELAVRGANGTNANDDVEKIADEFEQLKKQLIMDGNFSFAGRYIFSGHHTEERLFNDDGTFFRGKTDNDINNPPITMYQIGVGEELQISTNGLNIFGYVEEEGVFVDKILTDTQTGSESMRAEFRGNFDLDADYTTSGQITINVGTQGYDLDMSGLDLSIYDLNKVSDVTKAKETIVSALKNAPAVPVTTPASTLNSVADVYFSENDELVVRSKTFGAMIINQSTTSGVSLGLSQTVPGSSKVEAQVKSGIIADSQVSSNFDGKQFQMVVNGVSRTVTIETVASPFGVTELTAAIQNSINKEFGSGKVTVSESGGQISFTTAESLPEGTKPSISIFPVKATKSKLISDFDEAIESIRNGDKNKLTSFIQVIDDNMSVVLTNLSDIGARTNRLDLVMNRINENNITFTKLLSNAQDADMSEVIMHLKNSENVYRASLSTGAKVIQPSLIDFLR